MLQILIDEEQQMASSDSPTPSEPECLNFLLSNRPLDLLVDLAIQDSPPGIKNCIFNWLRRLLSCLKQPPVNNPSLFQPIQKMVDMCNGSIASPYETEEVLFLETVAGLVRQNTMLVNLFLKSHHHSAQMLASLQGSFWAKTPINNPLFTETGKIENSFRRISIIPGEEQATNNDEVVENNDILEVTCDCDDDECFTLFDAIVSYLESADSTIVLRSCEGILILSSSILDQKCNAIRNSLSRFTTMLSNRLAEYCQMIPEDMDAGDIEDSNISWGLNPRDCDQPHFIGRYQLTSFLSWLDYCDVLMRECPNIAEELGAGVRTSMLVGYIEPGLLGVYGPFMLVLTSKIIKKTQSKTLLNGE
jgi:hypothetical protein